MMMMMITMIMMMIMKSNVPNYYLTGENQIQVKFFKPRLILIFPCLQALIIHELRLGDKRKWELT